MKKSNELIVTLNILELRGILADVLEEKLSRIVVKTKEKQEDVSLISRLQAGKLFQVSTTTIDAWRRHRILPGEIKICSRVFFDRNQIYEALKRKQNNPNEFYNS